MIRLTQCRIPCGEGMIYLDGKIRKTLKMKEGEWKRCSWTIARHAVDARKKPLLFDVYTIDVDTGLRSDEEARLVRRLRSANISIYTVKPYQFPETGKEILTFRPVVIGTGPAGLFCALMLAENGYRPLVLERGAAMEERIKAVNDFWESGVLDPSSNVQFGEGGAGTFSDGKLNTQVKDPSGRIRKTLETFVEAGAPDDILYENLPHIGTDRLREVIPNLRKRIIEAGGEVRFGALVTGFKIRENTLESVIVGNSEEIRCNVCILAPGHSARDTIRELFALGVPMETKNFAMGMRVSHPQKLIDQSQYGISDRKQMEQLGLAPASYKLTAQASSGRGVYTFCMCPGGYVVNASSEENRLAVNGMSDCDRGSKRANSAVVMTVGAAEFGGAGVLDGMLFQERLEERAYQMGRGMIPAESYTDFRTGEQNGEQNADDARELLSSEELCVRGKVCRAPLHKLLSAELTRDFVEGMEQFGRKIEGFAGGEAFVLGLESRTSSPVRILRNENLESSVSGLYPCGEGAGYAGGITSAAVDGIRVAEAIARRYAPFNKLNK